MPAEDFANTIIKKLKDNIGVDGSKYTSSTPSKANQAIADGITEYILDNTNVQIGYAGTISGTTPDPIVADVCEVTGKCPPPTGTTFNEWIKSLESSIISGFNIGTGKAGVTPIMPTPVFVTGLVISQNDIKSIHVDNLDDPQKPIWTFIANSIMNWINSSTSGITYSATNTNSGSTGTATIVKIIIT